MRKPVPNDIWPTPLPINQNQNKSFLLNPKSSVYSTDIPLLLSDHELKTRSVYMCPSHSSNVAEIPNVACPQCRQKMTVEVFCVNVSSTPVGTSPTAAAEGGFVKGVVTYMVMDNLELKPMSTSSSITMLNRFDVKNVGSLEEKVVHFGVEQGLKLLKVSLECKNVFTSIFLGNNGAQRRSCT
ncbi:hypothetical protein Patl1_06275 [Pistacia atlantica]|uniref:Uncharacterized protein n=1 Tax=Pistacia atlantica TaxID=434234 RepID=A0ACC1BQI2_9ROSI|nr:hypothetical protein Patl1_06275 [Pistacia atlantica]